VHEFVENSIDEVSVDEEDHDLLMIAFAFAKLLVSLR